jgi:hydroxyethylthiazole kinase-like uncharacterized protein yjeF
VKADQLALPVAAVRRAEAAAMAKLPFGTLMQRAAAALAVECAQLLREVTGGVAGRSVVLLIGAGANGGDALYAGARLARRGVAVEALLVADRWHTHGAQALRRAGGRITAVTDSRAAVARVAAADLVVDGIVGIGGRGALRDPAAILAAAATAAQVAIIAVDLPSGVDADTGAVTDATRVVQAYRTVVFGVLKLGLLLPPGAAYAGDLTVIDIGLDLDESWEGGMTVVDDVVAARAIPLPTRSDDKYTRGVVGISAGSARYPGAAVLATGSARHGVAGYVRYAGPAATQVAANWPDVVAVTGLPSEAGRVQCWVIGPGRGTDGAAHAAVLDALALAVPVVLDADALTILSEHADVRKAVRDRAAVTVLTPHAGEFARLGGGDLAADRFGAARDLAATLQAVVLLKGAATLVVTPEGAAYLAHSGAPELATAGSGDVLSGLLGSLLAHGQSRRTLTPEVAAELAAGAAHVHGIAGQIAAEGGRSVAAGDVLAAVPDAIARVRGRG